MGGGRAEGQQRCTCMVRVVVRVAVCREHSPAVTNVPCTGWKLMAFTA
jgi:hypothetical protein